MSDDDNIIDPLVDDADDLEDDGIVVPIDKVLKEEELLDEDELPIEEEEEEEEDLFTEEE